MQWREMHIKSIWKLCKPKKIPNQKRSLKETVKKLALMKTGKILFPKEGGLPGESE
jgi:hypothetical protein